MERTHPYRPTVSRETRRLFSAGAAAVAVLWLLARVNVGDQPSLPGPVPAVLSQLTTPHSFDGLARDVAALQSSVGPSITAITFPDGTSQTVRVPALRVRDDLAVLWRPSAGNVSTPQDASPVARDSASGLTVVRLAQAGSAAVDSWAPPVPGEPQYLVSANIAGRGLALHPVFIAALEPVENPRWHAPVWAVPGPAALTPGTFLFSTSGRFAGLVVRDPTGVRIVPAATLLSDVERLLREAGDARPGTLGIEVQPLTPAIAAVSGATAGAVIAWADPQAGASTQVHPGDVIEAVGDRPIRSTDDWQVHADRLHAGDAVQLRLRTPTGPQVISLVAAGTAAPAPPSTSLGLSLRRHQAGSQIVRVDTGSVAARAGLTAGDVITRVGTVNGPTPAQVTRTLLMRGASGVLTAITRGSAHLVLAVEP